MPDRPNFPIPSVIDPPQMCLQICVPDDPIWKQVIAGLLFQPAEWFNWQRDDEKSGKDLAQVWRKIYNEIDWSNMSCCCGEQPPLIFRWNGTVYEKSSDGGVTWEPAPEYDYRNISTIWPSPEDLGIPSTKCQAADGVVVAIRDQINQQIVEDMAAAQIVAVVAAALLIYLSAGTSLAISASVTALAASIIGAGVSAYQAAFTTEVYEQLLCAVFTRMNSDDSIDEAGLSGLLADVTGGIDGIAGLSLYGYINAAGVVGLTNMMRSNNGDPDADCSECIDDCANEWDIYPDVTPGRYGTIIERGEGYIIAESTISTAGTYYLILQSAGGMADCCYLTSHTDYPVTSPQTADGLLCGETFPVHAISDNQCIWLIQMNQGAPFTRRLTFSDCP